MAFSQPELLALEQGGKYAATGLIRYFLGNCA